MKEKKKLYRKMTNFFLRRSCTWIKNRANFYLDQAPIGIATIEEIKRGWQEPKIVGNRAYMRNTDGKAVFVEFGVGVVGQQEQHANASTTGYAYNVPSEAKDPSGGWYFFVEWNRTNIPSSDLEQLYSDAEGSWYYTHGTTGQNYTYQALMDYESSGKKEVWEIVKSKYWK